jgi:signal transduction histidine kinase
VRVARRGTNEVQVTVEDTGEGLDADASGRMFDRFWRGDRARTTPGAGLGLAIARELATRMDGTVELVSQPGLTRFVLSLPRATAPVST